MITTDLYIRVSTEEQADKGYSQRYQEEQLRKYCELKNYYIRRVYIEDHSAKNFDRPEFNKLLLNFKKEKGIVNMLLFTKWDRFSRNAADAYGMIKELNRLGIEAFAIEQPIDISVPENKIMLAFYLASPEVENDRRSLNVAGGMRKALKEGRYMGKAPIGYCNKKDEHRKWIAPDPVNGPLIKKAFEDVALGKYSVESILKFTRAGGLACSKNNFWNALRNPVYCGKIIVPAFKNEPECIVNGQHMPLISEYLFNQVQAVLDGKKKIQKAKITENDLYPLRGFIKCSSGTCSKLLTASASKGRKQYYEYYHCTSSCGTRYPASAVNEAILAELRKWKPHPAIKELYRHVLADVLSRNDQQRRDQLKKINADMIALTNRQTKARDLLMNDALDPDDYRSIKKECDQQLMKLEGEVAAISAVPTNIQPQIEAGISALENIDIKFSASSTAVKRQILDSMFPEKLVFDGVGYRTTRVNQAVQLIFNLGEAFGGKAKGPEDVKSNKSFEVIPLGHFSNHFMHDLRKLAQLHSLLKNAS